MAPVVTLDNGASRVGIVPSMGAGLAGFEVCDTAGTWHPILRPWSGEQDDGPFALASNLLLPWSGRISGGGFDWRGRFHALQPNLTGERFPIHGNGFQLAWDITSQAPDRIELAVTSHGPGPFRYDASVTYRLTGPTLDQSLSITNRADEPLPYGLGFHPWFVRTNATMLQAPAKTVWLEDADYLPAGSVLVTDRPGWNFATAKNLPPTWINNLFIGWPRTATIHWADRRLSACISASDTLAAYLIYSPSSAADFFCFEPVSHLIDAIHQTRADKSELGQLGGLIAIDPGETVNGSMAIEGCFTDSAGLPPSNR